MRGDKKGQFFLLAAVIISVIVIGLGAVTNRVLVQNNYQDIDGLSYEVERELGEVLNYEIYTVGAGSTGESVKDFADKIAADIKDKDPNVEFIFIFGSSEDGINVTNYGQEEISVTPREVVDAVICGYDIISLDKKYDELEDCPSGLDCKACAVECPNPLNMSVCSDIFGLPGKSRTKLEKIVSSGTITYIPVEVGEFDSEVGEYDILAEDLTEGENVVININGTDISIPVSKYNQAYLIIKKDSNGETFINVL